MGPEAPATTARARPTADPTAMTRIATTALLALLVSAPAHSAELPEAPALPVESFRLANGLKVVLHRDPSVPRVAVVVAYHVGSKNERAGRTGFAHFFEHMMFRGTKSVPNYDIPLQEAGTQTNAFTSEDMTVYFEAVPSNYLERALYLEAERLAFLPTALDQSKFDTEREVVKNERRQSYENVPYGLAEEAILAGALPKGHPYSWSVIGSMRDLGDATLDDLRRFFGEFYHPGNATLTLAGDFDPVEAKALIARYFGPLAAGPDVPAVKAPVAPPVAKRIEQVDDVQLPRVYLAWPTVADDHPDAPALDVLASVLAGGEASRLYKALVRESAVATDVSAASDGKEIAGLFTIDATAAEGKSAADLEAALDAELARLRAEPPTAAEVDRALAKYEKGTLAALTAPLNRAFVLAIGSAQHNDPEHYRADFDRHVRVTPDDLARVAAKYLTPERLVLAVRPAVDGEALSEAVLAGPLATGAPDREVEPRLPKAGDLDWSRMPAPADPRAFRVPKLAKSTLDNGLEVWTAPWSVLPLVSTRLILPIGTGDDPDGKSGLATLTAALLDKGTKDRTAVELAEAFDALGATLSVDPGVDSTTVSFSVVERNLAPTLDLLAETLTAPRFDPADFDRERQLQLADLLQGPDNPGWIAQRAFRAVLYGKGHPYGNPSQGYAETVGKLTIDDVRDFHRAGVTPRGAKLIVVGPTTGEALGALLAPTLGRWTGPEPAPRPRPDSTTAVEPGVVYLVDKPGAVQSVVSVGRRWVDRSDPRYFAAAVGNRILGGEFLSRLNQNLRERNGFTYGANSSFIFRKSGSVWAVSTSVRADATAPALREVILELEGLAGGEKPFTAEEVRLARDAEVKGFPEGFDSPGALAGIVEEIAQFGLPIDYLDTVLDRLQATDREGVAAVMAEVVERSRRVVLVVGDRKVVEPALREAGFETVRLLDPDGNAVGG